MDRCRDCELTRDLLLAILASESVVTPVREWAVKYNVDLGKATNHRVITKAIKAAIKKAVDQP